MKRKGQSICDRRYSRHFMHCWKKLRSRDGSGREILKYNYPVIHKVAPELLKLKTKTKFSSACLIKKFKLAEGLFPPWGFTTVRCGNYSKAAFVLLKFEPVFFFLNQHSISLKYLLCFFSSSYFRKRNSCKTQWNVLQQNKELLFFVRRKVLCGARLFHCDLTISF